MRQSRTKLTFRAEREFGLIVGGILVLLSAWWLYRGKVPTLSHIALPFGAMLILFAVVFPRALRYPNKGWKAISEVLGFISSRVILGLVFFGVVTPVGLIKRLFGWDPLNRRAGSSNSYWKPYSDRQSDPRHYEKMF